MDIGSMHRFPCELTAKFQANAWTEAKLADINNHGFLVSYQRPANASSPRLGNRKVITVFLEFIIVKFSPLNEDRNTCISRPLYSFNNIE